MQTERSIERLSRDRILDASRRHFARFGYRKASLTDIAADLGVVKGALYYHVPGGKRELLEAVMAREEERLLESMSSAAEAETDPSRALVAAIDARMRTLREMKDIFGVRRDVGQELAELLSEGERDFLTRERALLEALLERGEAAGTFRPIRPRAATAAAIQAMFQALQVSEIYGNGGSEGGGDRLLDAVYDLMLRGLERRD